MEPVPRENTRSEAQTGAAVVVSGEQDYVGVTVQHELRDHIVEQLDGFGRRYGAVIHITGHNNDVRPEILHDLEQLGEHVALVVE
jgi:hypothetical protein